MAEINVPVKLQIQNLQQLIGDLQNKLSNLKVGSAGFKSVQNIITSMKNELDKLQIQTSKPFIDANQFTRAESSVDKLEDELQKVAITLSRIKFTDLELTPQQKSDLQGFEDQINSIKASLKTVKDTAKQDFLGSAMGKLWKEQFDDTAITKSFSQITNSIRSEVNKQNSIVQKAQETLTNYQNAMKANTSIENFLKVKNPLEETNLGVEKYNEIFQNTKNGIRFKSGGSTILEDWLKTQLQLDDATINKLVDGSAQTVKAKLEERLKAIQLINQDTLNKNANAESTAAVETAKYEQLRQIMEQLGASEATVAIAEQALRQQLGDTSRAMGEYQEKAVNAARSNDNIKTTSIAMTQQLESLRGTLQQANGEFIKMQRTQQSFNQMKMAIVSFMGFNQVLNLTKNAIRNAISHIKELDTVMNGISIVTDMSTSDLWNQVDAYSKMAQSYGVSIKGAYEVSQIYYQQGLQTADVLTLTNETLKLAKISGLDYATTTDYMTTAIRGFKMEMSEASTVVDVYSNLAAHTAVSQEELAVAMSKTASSMEGVGATFEEASAMIGTMVAVTRESATNIGSAMKSIASRYGELTKDPTKLVDEEGEAMAFNKVDAALQSVGISMRTVDGQFREFTDVIVELGEKWDQLDSVQQRYIATQFAGNRQQSRFLALVSNVDLLKSNLDVAMNSEDTGTLQALKALDSIETKIEQVRVAYQQFYTTLGAENVWKGLLDGTKNVINTLNSLPKLFNKIPLGAIAMIANLVSLIRQILTTVLSSVASIWQETIAKSGNEAAASGTNVGRTYAQNVKAGIESETPNVQAAINKMLGGNGIITTNPQANATNAANTMVNTFAKNTQISSNEAERNKQADEYLNNLVKAEEKLGTNFNDGQLNQLLTIGDKIISGDLSSYDAAMQAKNIILGVGQATEQTQTKGNALFNSLKNGTSKASRGFMGVASTLTTIGLLLNKDTDATRILSGALSGIGGAIQTGTAAIRVFSGDFAALPQLLTGILNIINGFGIAIETPAERLEKLNKTAENLTNISKQEKANYNTLENSLKKLNELQEKRQEGAEAAEEYQTAVDDLAEKFPEMIAGFDEAGNIIIDTTDAERILAEAREKSKQATYDAAQAEFDASKERRDQARQALKNYTGLPSLTVNSDVDLQGQTKGARSQLIQSLGGIVNSNEDDLLLDNMQTLERLYTTYKSNNQLDYQFLEKAKTEDKTLSLDLLQTYLEEQGDNRTEQEQQIYDMFFSMQTSTAISARFSEITSQLDTLLKDENASQEDILSAYTELESVFSLAVKSNQFDETDLANARQKISNIGELITTWTKENNIYKGYEKQVVSAWQQSSEADSKAWEALSQSSAAAAMVTKQIVNTVGDADFNKLKEDTTQTDIWRGYQETMATFIDSLTTDELSDFERMMNDSANYTTEDFSERFGYKIENIISFLETWFTDGLTSINQRIDEDLLKTSGETDLEKLTGFYKDLNEKRDKVRNNITTTEENYFHQIIAQYDALTDQGFTSTANEYGTAALGLFDSINSLNGDLEKTIWQLIFDNGLKTIEGINASIEAVNLNTSIESAIKTQIIEYLTGIKDTIIPNLNLSIQTATSDLLESWSDTSSELSKAMESGLSLQETDKLIAKLESFNISVNLDTDFTQSGDKLILTAEKFTEYWQALANAANTNAMDWQNSINTARAILGSMAIGPNSLDTILGNENDLIALKTIGIDLTDEKYRTQDWSTTLAEIDAAITSSSDGLKRFMWYNETAAKQLAQSWNWEQGNYIGSFKDKSGKAVYDPIFNSIDELIAGITEDLSNPKANKKGTERRDLLDHLYESYDALISDVLSNGINNINLDNYAGIIKEQKPDIEAALKGSYTDFITKYIQFAGKSISETNDLIAQAIEKDREKISVDLIKDLQFFNQTQFKTNLSGLNELANKLGKDLGWLIEHAVISSNDAIDEYIVDATKIDNLDLSSTEFQNTIQNSIQDFFNSLASYISNALKGNLSSDNARELQEFATNQGIGKLNFTQTADGLKLANDSARKVVAEVEKLDSLQGQVLFEELMESLIKSEDAFKSISSTTAYIKDLEKELAQLRDQEETPDNDKRIKALEQELDLAKKINATRATTEDDTFKFMDQKIPSGQNNPLNYWKNWTEAFEKIQETTKGKNKGTMAYEDFYNIVTEMGNIAQYTKDGINIGGEVVKNAKQASDLIEKAAGALSSTSTGEMVVDLKAIGLNFATGVDGMAKGVDEGIDALAGEQIKMLDSMIQLLETVVAMEELGKIDVEGNGLDFSELFDIDTDWITGKEFALWRKGAQDAATEILKTAETNEDLKKGLEQVKVNGQSIGDILKSAKEGAKLDKNEAIAYHAALSALYDAMRSGDYDLDDIYTSIRDILAGTDFEGDIDVGDLHLTVHQGVALERKGDKYIVNGYEYTDADTAVKAQQTAALGDFTNAIKTTNPETGETTYTAGELNATVQYDVNSKKYHLEFSDGTSADAADEASARFALQAWAQMKGGNLDAVSEGAAAQTLSFTYDTKAGVVANIEADVTTGKITYSYGEIQSQGQAAVAQELTKEIETIEVPLAATTGTDQNINLGVTGNEEVTNILTNISKILDEIKEKTNISITITDETTEALAQLKADLNNPENNDPIIKEVKARITEYINGEGENADPNKLVSNLQGILTTYEPQISEDQKTAIEGLIGIISTAQPAPDMILPEIKNLVANLTIGKNEPKAALESNDKTAKKGLQQDIDITSNETSTALKDNQNEAIKGVTQEIKAKNEQVVNELKSNQAEAPNYDITQTITVKTKYETEGTPQPIVGAGNAIDRKGGSTGGGTTDLLADLYSNPLRKRNGVQAKGNVALAQGTLMGELGPELYVTGGRYFIAGQNGAEFVDLPDDAIVFNHLQTRRLMSTGFSSRGTPTTSEKNAISFATGNWNGGEAMASASAALTALKQLRAMWTSLAGMNAKDLAGAGGSGGGGGGGSSDDQKAFLKDLEKWYNWLQEIDKLEQHITYQETLRSKIQSDMVAHGQDYFKSELISLDNLDKEVAIQKDLYESQAAYFEKRMAQLNSDSNPFSSLYSFDEKGQLKYKEGKLEQLSYMSGTDQYGKPNMTAEEQYNYIVNTLGIDASYLQYDDSGNEIKKTDDDGKENENYYTEVVEAFWNKIDADKEEAQTLYDSVQEHKEAMVEKQGEINELLQDMEDNTIDLEGKVYDAIVDMKEREIKEFEDTRDQMKENNEALINGLNEQLAAEKEAYEQQESEDKLTSLQRRLSILQRSGGSASEIASLEDEITTKQQEMYWDSQQAEIDALQEASETELEKLDAQIELMTETLAYQKENGLLNAEVYAEMKKSPQEIANFIATNNSDYWGKTPQDFIQATREDLFSAQRWSEMLGQFGGIDKLIDYYTKQLFGQEGNDEEAQQIGDKINGKQETEETGTPNGSIETKTGTWKQNDTGWWYEYDNGDYEQNSWKTIDGKKYRFDENGYMKTGWYQEGDKWYYLGDYGAVTGAQVIDGKTWNFDENGVWDGKDGIAEAVEESASENEGTKKRDRGWHVEGLSEVFGSETLAKNAREAKVQGAVNSKEADKWAAAKIKYYSEGGLDDYTGLAMLHGTKSKPEAIFNASQTHILRDEILSNKPDSLLSLLSDWRAAQLEMQKLYDINNNTSSISIEKAEVIMQVQHMNNDYDAQRAGDQALEQIMKIARKSIAQNRIGR